MQLSKKTYQSFVKCVVIAFGLFILPFASISQLFSWNSQIIRVETGVSNRIRNNSKTASYKIVSKKFRCYKNKHFAEVLSQKKTLLIELQRFIHLSQKPTFHFINTSTSYFHTSLFVC